MKNNLFTTLSVLATGALAAVDYPPLPEDLTTPFQQRLAVYGPNAVSVGWNTYQQMNQGCVQYGTSSDALTSRACSSVSTTYASSRTWSNAVVLSDLAPATTYYYKIVSGNSTVNHFMSPRLAGDTTPFTMDVVIDLGVYGKDGYTLASKKIKRSDIPHIQPELNHTTIGSLARTIDDYELVIHPGDFAYADDWYLKIDNLLHGKDSYQSILEQFYDQLAPIAARKPYMASPGNHEAACTEVPFTSGLCPEGQRNFTDFMHRFAQTMPAAYASRSSSTAAQSLAAKAKALSNPPFWYSFEYGMAHVVMINTETDFPKAPDGKDGSAGLGGGPFGTSTQQLDFLAADLASVDRTVTPWVIVAGHRPWYTTGTGSCGPCQDAFEGLLYRYGVDLAIFGHQHNSQRFLPVVNGTADANGMTDPKAPMYIVAGGAGNIEGLTAVGTKPSYTQFAYADDYSYVTVSFEDRNHLRVDFLRSGTEERLDSSTLYKSHAAQFVVQ
ncbi:purple acid phosphatase family protein [Aspergillus clavatus NRRL 1]|uniref:Purple acid phosphatase n=1 Tax=Aspergillus clavatus (strain ATCC 1007 / CBS 513.65 / DSM 816 / NCTC 3887 / NRRL 1 / QM 1276 / 107) TaxID=344612 RepID=A1CGH8_ASPCL|nr:acid phosphatase, putative [Aspergillus clavatus NRRL 1]EAW11058.1 acid phosphatase, putative [Aspergillus clavatus NRRL 1]